MIMQNYYLTLSVTKRDKMLYSDILSQHFSLSHNQRVNFKHCSALRRKGLPFITIDSILFAQNSHALYDCVLNPNDSSKIYGSEKSRYHRIYYFDFNSSDAQQWRPNSFKSSTLIDLFSKFLQDLVHFNMIEYINIKILDQYNP